MQESFVYILASKRNGTLYVGSTSNLAKRIWEHKNKIVTGFTATYSVNQLVYYEMHQDIVSAAVREKRLKNWCRAWKINIIEKFNPGWRDLYLEISSY